MSGSVRRSGEKKDKRLRRNSLNEIINLMLGENKDTPPMIHFSWKMLLMGITKSAVLGL